MYRWNEHRSRLDISECHGWGMVHSMHIQVDLKAQTCENGYQVESIYLSIYLSIYIYLSISIYIYLYLSISIYPSIYPSIYLSIMRPTLGNYFEVGVGYGTICLKWFPIFNINFMLTSANKNHSKIIYAPVTRWWCKIIFHLQRLKHLGIILSKQPKAPQNNFSVELGTLFHRVPTV